MKSKQARLRIRSAYMQADKRIEQAFDALNEIAYSEDSPLSDEQRIYVARAMKQLSHAAMNVIEGLS